MPGALRCPWGQACPRHRGHCLSPCKCTGIGCPPLGASRHVRASEACIMNTGMRNMPQDGGGLSEEGD
jgi:hypothetical protein